MSFLSIELLNELSYPFHLIYNLSPFFFINFSALNSSRFVLCNSVSKNVPTISSPLWSLITFLHGTVLLTFLLTKFSSDQIGASLFAKMFLYFHILIILPISNLETL